MTSLDPTFADRRAGRRDDPRARPRSAVAWPASGRSTLLGEVGIPDAAAALRRSAAPPERRHAPARRDRRRARERPGAARRRRADDGARRDDPGADPRPPAASCATARGTAIVLITHDLGVVAQVCDRVVRDVRRPARRARAGRRAIFDAPAHPYTTALLDAMPTPRHRPRVAARDRRRRVPDLADPPPGCRFAPALPARWTPASDGRASRAGDARPRDRLLAVDGGAGRMSAAAPALLEARGVTKRVPRRRRPTRRARRRCTPSTTSISTSAPARSSAVVGESGSGKTTLGRCILGLMRADGRLDRARRPAVRDAGERARLAPHACSRSSRTRYGSLDPRWTVAPQRARAARRVRAIGTPADRDAPGRRSCSTSVGLGAAASPTAARTSSRAASASASASPRRWRLGPRPARRRRAGLGARRARCRRRSSTCSPTLQRRARR